MLTARFGEIAKLPSAMMFNVPLPRTLKSLQARSACSDLMYHGCLQLLRWATLDLLGVGIVCCGLPCFRTRLGARNIFFTPGTVLSLAMPVTVVVHVNPLMIQCGWRFVMTRSLSNFRSERSALLSEDSLSCCSVLTMSLRSSLRFERESSIARR